MANHDSVNDIYWIYPYHKYWLMKGIRRNQAFDATSALLLDSKKREGRKFATAVQFLTRAIGRFITNECGSTKPMFVAIVPSSSANKWSQGITDAVDALRGQGKIYNAEQMLRRHTSVPKAATGGARGVEIHKGSIEVMETTGTKKRPVIIVDDITTTGCTLIACRDLLRAVGYKSIIALAIGKTASE
ncbi:MAG: phosphoribosyltransferase family protein [Gammaproteobacteria bacterium]